MIKKHSEHKRTFAWLGVALVALIIGAVGYAQTSGNVINNTEGGVINFISQTVDDFGAFISSGTNFTDVIIANDLDVQGIMGVSGTGTVDFSSSTTTLDLISLGSQANSSFAFTASSTVGSLFSIQNTGAPRICHVTVGELSISPSTGAGADGVGDTFTFSIGTSTSATLWSGAGESIVASTTFATGTVGFASNVVNAGTYVGGDQDIGGAPWLWENSVYLNGIWALTDAAGTSNMVNATGTAFAGEAYVTCHTR